MKHLEFNTDRPQTLVFLHGGNVAGWMWGQQVPAFADHRILVPDFPGFGESNDEPWVSVADTADRVAELLGETPAHVVGLSLGSSVALELAARHPGLVKSLFLASAQAAPPRRRDMVAAQVMLKFWDQRAFWTSQVRSYGLTGEDAELFVTTGLGIRRETAEAIFAEVKRGVPWEVLERVESPTIAVAGERDSSAMTGPSLERIAGGIPRRG
jgi:pimeloyl-ACP methyl ester carboxylesterase